MSVKPTDTCSETTCPGKHNPGLIDMNKIAFSLRLCALIYASAKALWLTCSASNGLRLDTWPIGSIGSVAHPSRFMGVAGLIGVIVKCVNS